MFFNKKGQKVFNNIKQLQLAKVGSNLREPQKFDLGWVNFIRCIVCFTIPISLQIVYGKCTKQLEYEGITSRDVFANYQAFSTHKSSEESTLEKLAVVAAFGSGIFLICFSVFLFF